MNAVINATCCAASWKMGAPSRLCGRVGEAWKYARSESPNFKRWTNLAKSSRVGLEGSRDI